MLWRRARVEDGGDAAKEKPTKMDVREVAGIEGEGKEETARSGKACFTGITRGLPAARISSIPTIRSDSEGAFGAGMKLGRRGAC